MIWLVVVAICLLGLFKSWEAFNGCIKSSAFVPAMNMLLMNILFLSLLIITTYVVRNYNIEKKFNIEIYGEQRFGE